jgi:hypothetical protein
MVELSRQEQVNHPGILIFDEPRQQSTKETNNRFGSAPSETIRYVGIPASIGRRAQSFVPLLDEIAPVPIKTERSMQGT